MLRKDFCKCSSRDFHTPVILDNLTEASCYHGVHNSLPTAFAWLGSYDPATPDGRYEIGGSGLIAIVNRYRTAPATEKKWETHRMHGDVQFMVSGSELFGYARRESLIIRTPYDEVRDAEFYEPPVGVGSSFTLGRGSFAIFLPQDGHQPGVMLGNPAEVHKLVIKFRL